MLTNKVVTDCLKQPSADQQLRNDWFSLTNEYAYPKPVAVFALEKVYTMFVKSKQQVNREKFALKPENVTCCLN